MSVVLDSVNEGWAWTGIRFVEIHAQSVMGHLMLSDEEGCYYYLDTDGMRMEPLGNLDAAKAHFAREETREIWEARGLIDPARERLGDPPEGSVFTLNPRDWITGDYKHENMCHLPLQEIVFLSGDLARQIKDLPDGQEIQIRIVD